MQAPKYIRRGNTIYGTDIINGDAAVDHSNVVFQGMYVNEAKRKSRELQGKDLGRGVLRVLG